MLKLKLIITILSFFSFTIFSQNICTSDEYNKPLIEESPKNYFNIEYELQQYLKNKKEKSIEEIVIPVVFHVVWIDTKQNLDDSVIQHQVDVLNKSFNKKNSDTIILTDTLRDWVGNFNIRFELAYIDPLGNVTNGITRTKTINPHFSYYGDLVKKSHYGKEPWPTDRYLNVWVCNLLDGFHGYAQFPGGPPETDGVVVDWQTVGKGYYPWTYPNSYNLACGKVLVHEIGHWLNLYHPWGNTPFGCGDDHIPETGLQDEPVYHTQECYDTLFSFCNPSERVFVKHYMDYSGCDCMVTFTKNQVERGLASLYTHRENIINSYVPRPNINYLEETRINPTLTEGLFYIHLPKYNGIVEVSIFDISGKLIEYRQLYETTFNIFDISNNSSGMYFIKINNNNLIITKKILKR